MSAFYEGYYLAQNPDVAKAVNAGLIGSGWEHYVKWGAAEGRSYAEPLLYDAFNELYYLAKYPDVATAVNAGIIGTGWDHYVQWGALEGRDGVSAPSGYNNFSEEYYLARNPDVAKAVNEGIIGSGWDHYVNWGKAEGRSFAEPAGYNDFNEVYYLANNPDVAKAVNSGDYGTGWQHYSEIGQSEGRSYAAPAPVNGAVLQSDALPETTIPYTGNVFTLYDNEVEVEGTPDVTAIYWGYTPCSTCCDPQGIPVEDLLSFLTTITGLDLYELGLIDDDGLGPFDNVTSLSLSNPLSSTAEYTTDESGDNDAEGGNGNDDLSGNAGAGAANTQLIIQYADGTVMTFNAEALLGEQYFYFLQNLLFYTDEDGLLQSRLFEKVVEEGTDGYTYLEPIILTPTINNGGTLEPGFTSAADDIIVAGRLDLLHQAYIDAGAGYDILEVDAKGVYAQPLQLLNIEEIRIQNLPNVYTYMDADQGNGILDEETIYDDGSQSDYPDTAEGPLFGLATESILDVSRATSLERLVITEGDNVLEDGGALTVVGIRNGATARFEGGFDEDVTLHYGQGITGELDVELAIGDITADINLLHNAAVLNVDSQGIENHMHAFFAGGSISRMIITGTGAFGVEEDLSDSFNADRPAIIDASANTGGLDVTLNGHYKVNIKGTEAYDEITAENSGDVTIKAYNGDNVIDVDGSEIVDITSLGGADEISAENGLIVTIAAGAGADKIDVDGSESIYIDAGEGADEISAENGETVTILAGNGYNEIDVDGSQTVDIVSGDDADTITSVGSETVTVDSRAGDDDITASALVIDIEAGDGNDKVVVAGLGGETEGTTAGAVNLMLILDDSGSMSGQNLDDLKAAANDMLDQVADSGADAAAVTIIFGTSVTSSCWGTIEDARAVINALTANSGGTDYAAAINSAMTAFGQNGAISGAANLSIFISDGYPSPGVDSTLQGQWETFLNNNDIVSYAIGIGGLTDDTPLEPIAYDGVKGTDIDPILGTGADLTDILSEIAGTIGLAGNNALVNLDLGDGQNIVQLGDDADLAQGLVAQEGSSISGENITLKVKAASDLRAAELSGITKVVLEDDNGDSAPILTLTAEQFEAIGGANFSVEGSVFHTHAFVKIIVGFDQEVSLTDLGVDDLPRGIDLYIEIEDEARVTMTAEQLHTHVAQDGIVLVDDGNTDYVNGKVVITGGGSDFDPFNTSDTIKTIIDGTVYYGGSLSDDFMVDGRWYNVTVKSVVNGYDRPADEEADIYITLDSTGTETLILEPGGFSTWHWNLEIIGDQDIVFDGPFALGMELGEPANPFTVDFSELEGEVFNFTLDNFEMLAQGGGIYGNSDNGYESEVLIHIADDDS
ncbi:MAG: VWA domain-containing protein, partial [Desulfobacterales bacterium]|nr:VWA domain-containing protein [Desulfobacterales bacterium]